MACAVDAGLQAGEGGPWCPPVRLGCQPAPVHLAVWRQVVDALHIRQPLALLPGVVVIDSLDSQAIIIMPRRV